MEMEKLKKMAVVIDTILKTVFIIVIVGLILVIVADIAILAIGPMNIDNGRFSYNIFGSNIVIADAEDLAGISLNGYQLASGVIMATVGGAIGMIVVLVGIKMLREIIAPMKEGGPFVEGISLKMRNFGIFVLIAGVVGNIIEGVMAFIVQYTFGKVVLDQFIGGADRITYMYTTDGSFIVFALFIFLLSYIFKYGEELQKQSDETF